jgi:hypothetical protein
MLGALLMLGSTILAYGALRQKQVGESAVKDKTLLMEESNP